MLVLVIAGFMAAACGSDPSNVASPAAALVEPGEEAAAANVVVLDAEAQQEAGVTVREVQRRTLPETITATGRITINENQTFRVGALTDGRIVNLVAREGDQVEKGQILAHMYSHDIHEARAEYQQAVAEVDRLRANLTYARSVRDRSRRLYDLKAASLQQVEQAEAELLNAQTAVEHGQVELERTRLHLEDFLGVQADVETKQHGDGAVVDLVPITSPAGGVLLKRSVTTGTVVTASGELFVITDLSTLWTMAAVAEEHLSKLRIGMPVQVRVQAYPDRVFPGRLMKLDTELDPTTRTIMARVEVPNGHGLLKPEMYATAEMELSGTREALYVPEIAVQEIDGEPAVFVKVAPERFERRVVMTAPGVGGNVEIVSGVRSGEQVVVEGSFLLKSQLLKSTLAEAE